MNYTNWLEQTIEHYIQNENLKENIEIATRIFRESFLRAIAKAPLNDDPKNYIAGHIAIGSFKINSIKKDHNKVNLSISLKNNTHTTTYPVEIDFEKRMAIGSFDIVPTDYFKELILEATAGIAKLDDYYPIPLPFNKKHEPKFTSSDYEGLSIADKWHNLKRYSEDEYNKIEKMVNFNQDLLSAQIFASSYDQGTADTLYNYFDKFDPNSNEFAYALDAVADIGKKIDRRIKSEVYCVLEKHFPDVFDEEFTNEFKKIHAFSIQVVTSDIMSGGIPFTHKEIYRTLMELGDLDLVKEFQSVFTSKSADDRHRVAGSLDRALKKIINIKDNNISPRDLYTTINQTMAADHSGILGVLDAMSDDYYKEYIALISKGDKLKRTASKGFMEFADEFESISEKDKGFYTDAFLSDNNVSHRVNVRYRIKEYDQFFDVVKNQMRGHKVLEHANNHNISVDTLKTYSQRHRKFQIALFEELNEPVPLVDINDNEDEPALNI